VVKRADLSGASFYGIGIYDPTDGEADPKTPAQSGQSDRWRIVLPERLAEVRSLCERIALTMRNQYTLSYSPPSVDTKPTYHRIEVKVKDPKKRKLTVRTRTGYYTTPTASTGVDREHSRRDLLLAFGGVLSYARFAGVYAQDFASYTDADREALLLGGTVVSVKDIGEGVTKPIRASLSWKGVMHSAQIQRVDRPLPDFLRPGRHRAAARDAWRFNVAAYRLDRLLQLNMVPVSVARSYKGQPRRLHLVGRRRERAGGRSGCASNGRRPIRALRAAASRRPVFDELIMNIDRNLGNLLITNSWQVVLIDHTRSFTPYQNIRNKENLTRCSRALLARMSALTRGDREERRDVADPRRNHRAARAPRSHRGVLQRRGERRRARRMSCSGEPAASGSPDDRGCGWRRLLCERRRGVSGGGRPAIAPARGPVGAGQVAAGAARHDAHDRSDARTARPLLR
jgi:hypothetical protein